MYYNEHKGFIPSLNGFKALMMLLIFYWHSPMKNPSADLGARMCEVLFVTSGFLVGYNYYYKEMPATFGQAWKYVKGKIAKVWPTHFIAFLLISGMAIKSDPDSFFTITNAVDAIVNLCLLQAWSTDYFSFNGAAWFISALLFCYYISPLLISLIKKKRFVAIMVSCIFLRIVLELCSVKGINILLFNYHVSPIIRCLEFFIGMLLIPWFFQIKNRISDQQESCTNLKGIVWSLIEIITIAVYVFLIFNKNDKWIRGYFVIAAAFLVFVFAIGEGFISKLFSLKPFMMFASIQMEFYILHQVIIRVLNPKVACISTNPAIQTVVLFLVILILATIYKKYLSIKLSTFVEKILNKL